MHVGLVGFFVVLMASSLALAHAMPSAPKELDEDDILMAFRVCPKLSANCAAHLQPGIMEVVQLIANTLRVSWQWVLAAVLCIIGGLVPRVRFKLAPSVPVPTSTWLLFLQPGAANGSGVIRLMPDTVSLLFEWLHQAEIHDARAEASTQRADAEAAVELPPRRQLVAGGGSVAATGMQMSLTQNRDAALCAEREFVQLLAWFKAESGMDSGIVAKSWGNVTWDRPVIDKNRAFTVQRPWLGIHCRGGARARGVQSHGQ